MNPVAIPVVLLTLLAGVAGHRLGGRIPVWLRLAIGVLAAIPAVLFAGYYAHFYDDWIAFHALRAAQGSEFLASLAGVGAGFVAGGQAAWARPARVVALATALGLVAIPFVKPLVRPLDLTRLRQRWNGDVCLQSSSATCGPCSGATLLRRFGIAATEEDLARDAFSTSTGTENWYLVRALRARGLDVHAEHRDVSREELPVPSIAGVVLGRGVGHFVTLLGETRDTITVGEPLKGTVELFRSDLSDHPLYRFTGFFLVPTKGPP